MRFWLRRNLHILFCRFIHCFVYTRVSEWVYVCFFPSIPSLNLFILRFSSFYFAYFVCGCCYCGFFSSACTYFENNKPKFTFQPQQHDDVKANQLQRSVLFMWLRRKMFIKTSRLTVIFCIFFSVVVVVAASYGWAGTHLVKCEFKMLCSKNSKLKVERIVWWSRCDCPLILS